MHVPAVDQGASASPCWPETEPHTLKLPVDTMVMALRCAADQYPQRPAIAFYGRVITYAELDAEVETFASHLRESFGVRPGDRVLLSLQNSPQFVIAYHAILRADAVVVSANPMYKTAELRHIVEETESKVAIAGEDTVAQFEPLQEEGGLTVVVARYSDYLPKNCTDKLPAVLQTPPVPLTGDLQVAWPRKKQPGSPIVISQATGEDLALLIYTSGTTGKPKACMHTHKAIVFTAYAQVRWYHVTAFSVVAAFQPLFHVAGMQHSMNTPIMAASLAVILTRWDRDLALKLIGRHGVSYLNAPPTMVVDLLSSEGLDRAALSTLRVVTGGGAAMPEAVATRLYELTGVTYVEAYGMTEAISPTHINPLENPKRKSGGISIHQTSTRIIEPESKRVLDVGEVGEILVSGPQIFQGYWRRPDATDEAFLEIDGLRYYRTGDIGWLDEEGYVYIGDRLKRMINASGFKVWPAEVEAMLYEHPAILECAVISTPDQYRGEDVKAFVVLRDDAPAGITEDGIVAWARAKMAVYKAPRTVEFSAALPRSPSNKIDWRVLQDREWAQAGK